MGLLIIAYISTLIATSHHIPPAYSQLPRYIPYTDYHDCLNDKTIPLSKCLGTSYLANRTDFDRNCGNDCFCLCGSIDGLPLDRMDDCIKFCSEGKSPVRTKPEKDEGEDIPPLPDEASREYFGSINDCSYACSIAAANRQTQAECLSDCHNQVISSEQSPNCAPMTSCIGLYPNQKLANYYS